MQVHPLWITEKPSLSDTISNRFAKVPLGEVPAKAGGTHVVALACSWMGENLAAANVTIVLERLPRINTVLVVGIAGAAPDPENPEHDVHLGDIVVLDSAGIIQYDYDKEVLKDGLVEREPRHPPRPPGARLLAADRELKFAELEGKRPWETFFKRASKLKWTRRPSTVEADVLHRTDNPEEIVPRLVASERRKHKPIVFRGPIASGNMLLKNARLRDRLRETFGVKAVEMEAAGVADGTWLQTVEYFVVRATCDYCDQYKNNAWQGHAAMIAAAYTRALLERMRSADPGLPETHTGNRLPEDGSSINNRSSKGKFVIRTDDLAPDDINSTSGQDDFAVAAIRAAVELFARTQGILSTITTVEPIPALTPPPGASARARRADAVMSITILFKRHTWIALNGTSGSGKTEVALLIAEGTCAGRTWLTLRDLTASEALVRLSAAITAIAGGAPGTDRTAWYDGLCTKLGEGHLFVIDDLPQFDADGPLGREFVQLVAAFRRYALKLLTTSAQPPPSRLSTRLGDTLHEVMVPKFTEEEASELLSAHGAPSGWCQAERVRFINAVTDGHAELLVTAAVFLKQKNWQFAEENLNALLRHEYKSSIETDVMRRLLTTVPEVGARQLLFRATLVLGSFTFDDILALSEVEPRIESPRSIIAKLEGLWIQRERENRFYVCPLVKKGFESEINPEVQRRVHSVLGLRIMRRSTNGPIEAQTAIIHFMKANEMDRAGTTYCIALDAIRSLGSEANDLTLCDFWSTSSLPSTMALAGPSQNGSK